jgi:hypothetical protein
LGGRWSIAAGGSQSSNTIAHFALAFSRKESVCVGKAGEDLMNALRIVACLAGLRSRYHHATRWTSVCQVSAQLLGTGVSYVGVKPLRRVAI